MSMTIQSSVKNKILTTPSETSKVENAPAEMLRDMDQQMEKRADDGKANVVTDALSRKERVKPRRVRAMAMTIQYGVRGMILAAQSEAFKQENVLAERLHGLDQQMERKGDESLYFMDRIWVLLVGSVMDEAHASRALPSREWRPKVTAIEESKDLSKLSLDELVGNLKVYEVVLEKDLEIAKNKKEKYKSLALKARQVLSDDDASSSDSNDEEYAMAVRDFKKFFRRRGKFVRQPYDDKKNFQKIKEDKKERSKMLKCVIQITSLVILPQKLSGDQRHSFVGRWSDSGDDSKKERLSSCSLKQGTIR
ncbi:hypothetical protein Tco_0105920 [Tanacetum coccineum]